MSAKPIIERRRLLVENLPNSIDADSLRGFISTIASPIEGGIKILPSKDPGKSCAEVIFSSEDDARAVITEFNYSNIDGEIVRFLINDPDAISIRQEKRNALCITNIDPGVEIADFHDVFEELGEVVYCNVYDGPDHSLTGFVQYRSPEDAERAISTLDHAKINSRAISVTRIPIHNKTLESFEDNNFKRVCLKNLPFVMKDEELYSMVAQYGDIQSHKIARKIENEKETVIGIFCFTTHQSAVNCIESLNGYSYTKDGSTIVASWYEPNDMVHETENCDLYVRRLPLEFTDKDLLRHFSKYGEVTGTTVFKNADGTRCLGFVHFAKCTDAKIALESERQSSDGLLVSFAAKKNERMKDEVRSLNPRVVPTVVPPKEKDIPVSRKVSVVDVAFVVMCIVIVISVFVHFFGHLDGMTLFPGQGTSR